MGITALKIRDLEFEIFFEAGLSDGNHCLK